MPAIDSGRHLLERLDPRPSARMRRQIKLEHLTRDQVRKIRRTVLAAGAAQNLPAARSQGTVAHELAAKYGVDFKTIVRATFQRVFY